MVTKYYYSSYPFLVLSLSFLIACFEWDEREKERERKRERERNPPGKVLDIYGMYRHKITIEATFN